MEHVVFRRVLRRTAILLPFLACFYGMFGQSKMSPGLPPNANYTKNFITPVNFIYNSTFAEMIYLPAEVESALGVDLDGEDFYMINSMSFYYSDYSVKEGQTRKLIVYLANVDKPSFRGYSYKDDNGNDYPDGKQHYDFVTEATEGVGVVKVFDWNYDGNTAIAKNEVKIEFSTPFKYEVSKNLLVAVASVYVSGDKPSVNSTGNNNMIWDGFTYTNTNPASSYRQLHIYTDQTYFWTIGSGSSQVTITPWNCIENDFSKDKNYTGQSDRQKYMPSITLTGESVPVEPNLWTEAVTSEPASWSIVNDTVMISNESTLAWFISYVNGYNDVAGGAHLSAKARLTADVDMGDYVTYRSFCRLQYVLSPNG